MTESLELITADNATVAGFCAPSPTGAPRTISIHEQAAAARWIRRAQGLFCQLLAADTIGDEDALARALARIEETGMGKRP